MTTHSHWHHLCPSVSVTTVCRIRPRCRRLSDVCHSQPQNGDSCTVIVRGLYYLRRHFDSTPVRLLAATSTTRPFQIFESCRRTKRPSIDVHHQWVSETQYLYSNSDQIRISTFDMCCSDAARDTNTTHELASDASRYPERFIGTASRMTPKEMVDI